MHHLAGGGTSGTTHFSVRTPPTESTSSSAFPRMCLFMNCGQMFTNLCAKSGKYLHLREVLRESSLPRVCSPPFFHLLYTCVRVVFACAFIVTKIYYYGMCNAAIFRRSLTNQDAFSQMLLNDAVATRVGTETVARQPSSKKAAALSSPIFPV